MYVCPTTGVRLTQNTVALFSNKTKGSDRPFEHLILAADKFKKGAFIFRNNLVKNTLLPVSILIILLLFGNDLLAHSWNAPKDAAQKRNPISLNQASVIKGKEIHTQNCANCHGDKAKGLSSEITGLQKNTPNLIQRLKSHSEGDFFWKIQNGKGDMPSFKEDLSENEIWNVINYIKSIEKPKK